MRQTVGILGTPIDILDTTEVLARLEQFIQERRFHQVATANTDFLINALNDPELQHILRNADLVMPDGMPVVWAARMMRSALPERVTGADIVPELASLAARKGYRLYMLGARPDVAQRARERMEADYPGVQIVGCVSPPVARLIEMDHEALLADIERAQPDILLVAFGNPKQEKWIYLNRDRLSSVPICIGVGGTFDFLAGNITRAPAWMQRSGIEWLYRLSQEPRRLWKRYVRDILQFSRYLLRQWWAIRQRHNLGNTELYVARVGECAVLSVVGNLDSPILTRFQVLADTELNAKRHLVLDLQGVTAFDGAALGTLINLSKRAAYSGCEVRLLPVPPAIEAALRRSQLHEGVFRRIGSVAQGFAENRLVGMCWQVRCGNQAAVVTVSGASDPQTALRLEVTCARLLEAGKRVDLDARDLIFADSHLLTSLYHLSCAHAERPDTHSTQEAQFRVVAGDVLHHALAREHLLGKIRVIAVPEIPQDAVEEPVEWECVSEETPAAEPLAVFAKGV